MHHVEPGGQVMARVDISDKGKRVVPREFLLAGIGRIRGMSEGSGGTINIATENRGILRLILAY